MFAGDDVPDGGWLTPAQTVGLLRCYGVPLLAHGDAGTPAGIEVSVRLADDHVFGHLVMLGLGDLPEVTAIRLDPVIAGPAGATVTSARVKVQPHQARDPFLRRLR